MTRKTVNLISLSVPGAPGPALVAGLCILEVTHVDLTMGVVELMLPDANRDATLRLARELSERHPAALVRAHLRVNARWLPRIVSTGLLLVVTHAHVVDVDVPAEMVIRTLAFAPPSWLLGGVHVQAVGRASQLVLHRASLAKNAAAFFRMSRSWRSISFSRRRRLISSCSGVKRSLPDPGKASPSRLR